MNFVKFITDWINENPKKFIGAFIGFLLGFLFLTIGILKTVFVCLLVLIGFIIGKSKDEDVSIIDAINKFIRRE